MKKSDLTVNQLLKKVQQTTRDNKMDLSSGEDLSIGVMNLISIEEHLFFSSQKTGQKKYIELLNEVRIMRTELMKKLVKDPSGEEWCISKHLLATSMRLIEVGTKELKKGDKKVAEELFDKAYKLYSLFWGINLDVVGVREIQREDQEVILLDEKGNKGTSTSIMGKLGSLVQKAIDCCKE